MLDDPGHEPEPLEHPNVHIAALFDGAIQFAREAVDARDRGRVVDVERRVGWVRAVLTDLAQRVSWGTGTIGRQISAILSYLSQRLVVDSQSREGLVRFADDLTTVYGLWSMICGHGTAHGAAA
jgi:flagellin-specific chaperone FliS